MKRANLLGLALALAFAVLTTSGVYAINYSGCQNNEATFETLEEARLSGPAAVQNLESNEANHYVSHYVLDGYPEGTTFIYRSANLYGGRAAARLNTLIFVFSEQHFDDKEGAKAFLDELGVIDLVDEATGSVILVTPADGASFGQADQMNYYKLQTAVYAQKVNTTDPDGNPVSFCDAEYFGGYGYNYVIGIDGGATFLNEYVSTHLDFVSRIAGMLLINGKMEEVRKVAAQVPVYLVNAPEDVIARYQAANETDAYFATPDAISYFNQALPLQKVVVATAEKDIASYIQDAYYGMFIKAMRAPVIKRGLNSAATPYQGYSMDQAPLSLCERNAVLGGVTADGIHLIKTVDERFSDIRAFEGDEYLQTWFEYLPEEVLDGTAPEHSVPLWLANHGGGDDPRLFVDEIGLLALAGKERFAIVAPEAMYINYRRIPGGYNEGILPEVLHLLVEYMLDTYPALDPERVYMTGYSMGGGATLRGAAGSPQTFAAIVPMAPATYYPTEEQIAKFEECDLPIMFLTSYNDAAGYAPADGHINAGLQEQINFYLGFNEMETVDYDFETYPRIGIKVDSERYITLNGEYGNYTWFLNKDGVPMVGATVTQFLNHALYPEYANLAWDFAKHYSRNQETLEIEYDPYVR